MTTNQPNAKRQPANSVDHLEASVQQLLVELQKPSAEIESLVKAIESIPGLKEAILNGANSPEFALRNEILRLQHAIAYLGLTRVKNTVVLFHEGTTETTTRPHMLRKPASTNKDAA